MPGFRTCQDLAAMRRAFGGLCAVLACPEFRLGGGPYADTAGARPVPQEGDRPIERLMIYQVPGRSRPRRRAFALAVVPHCPPRVCAEAS
jgi:hypothetical protein